MSRILNLLSTPTPIPAQSDPEFADYNILEQRLILKCGGSKEKLLYLLRRVKGRDAYFSGAKHGITIVPGITCTAPVAGQLLQSDTLRASGQYGAGMKLLGNELFVGEPGALGSIFVVGEVHYYTRADENSNFVRQSGFFSPTQSSGAQFGTCIDYDGSRVAIGEPNVARAANIFNFNTGIATIEQEFTANTYTAAANRFGQGIAIKGSHALVGAPGQNLTQTAQGGVEYWTESSGVWTFQQAFTMNGAKTTASHLFGAGLAMTNDTTAFIGWNSGTSYVVEKWTRSGATWTFNSVAFTITGYDVAATPYMQMDTDGTNLIIGFPAYDDGGIGSSNYGAAIVCDQSGTIASEIIGETTGSTLGQGVTIDGNEAVIGSPLADPSATSNAGTAQVWEVCT